MLKKITISYLLMFTLGVTPLMFFSKSTQANSNICSDGQTYIKKRLAGDIEENLCETYIGKVLLVVNTASKCGFTYQYEGLETLYDRYKDQGLVVMGFPSNDFGGQEPGTETQIRDFCVNTYAIRFPMFEKTAVRGKNREPFYQALVDASGSSPKWNFHKYLIDRKGNVIEAYTSLTKPLDKSLVKRIEDLLAQ